MKPAQSGAPEMSSSATGVLFGYSEWNAIRVIGRLVHGNGLFRTGRPQEDIYTLKNAIEHLLNAMFPID
jgi:hypothetical protein